MLDARIELRGEDLYCSDLRSEGVASVKRLTSGTLSLLQEWAGRYDAAVASRQPGTLAAIGRDIAALGLPTAIVFEGGYAVAEVGVNVANVLEGFGT